MSGSVSSPTSSCFWTADEFISPGGRAELAGSPERRFRPAAIGSDPLAHLRGCPRRGRLSAGSTTDHAMAPTVGAPSSFGRRSLGWTAAYRRDLMIEQGNHALSIVSVDDVPTVHLERRGAAAFPGSQRQPAHCQRCRRLDRLSRALSGRQGRGSRLSVARGVRSHRQGEATHSGRLICRHYRSATRRRRAQSDWASNAVQDCPPDDYQRRYSDGSYLDPVVLIARSWERSLTSRPSLLQLTRPMARIARCLPRTLHFRRSGTGITSSLISRPSGT